MGFPRKEYWSGLPFPFPGDLPHPGTEPVSLVLQADSFPLSHQESPGSVLPCCYLSLESHAGHGPTTTPVVPSASNTLLSASS